MAGQHRPPPAPVTPRRACWTPRCWTPRCWAPAGPAFQPGRASCRRRLASSGRNCPAPASGAAWAARGRGSPGTLLTPTPAARGPERSAPEEEERPQPSPRGAQAGALWVAGKGVMPKQGPSACPRSHLTDLTGMLRGRRFVAGLSSTLPTRFPPCLFHRLCRYQPWAPRTAQRFTALLPNFNLFAETIKMN